MKEDPVFPNEDAVSHEVAGISRTIDWVSSVEK